MANTPYPTKAETEAQISAAKRELEAKIDVIGESALIYSVADEAAMTAKWNELDGAGNTPEDGVTQVYREDLKQYWKWDSSVPAKGVYSRDFDLSSIFNENINDINNQTIFTDEKYITSSGNIGNYSTLSASGFRDVLPNRKIKVRTKGIATSYIAFYTKAEEFISSEVLSTTLEITEYTTPENCYKTKYSCDTNYKNQSWLVMAQDEIFKILDENKTLSESTDTKADNNSNEITEIKTSIGLEIISSGFTWTDEKYIQPKSINPAGALGNNDNLTVSNFITLGTKNKVTFDAYGFGVASYGWYDDEDDEPIETGLIGTDILVKETLSLFKPLGATRFRTTTSIAQKDTFSIKLETVTDSSGNEIEQKSVIQDLGVLEFQPFVPGAMNTGIKAGQSLARGEVSKDSISTTSQSECYMLGTVPTEVVGSFNPLKAAVHGSVGEAPIVSTINALKRRLDYTYLRGLKMLGLTTAVGGQSIEKLSKNCTNTVSGTTADNYYNTVFLQALQTSRTNCDSLSIPFIVNFIDFNQGQANQTTNDNGDGLTTGTNHTYDKDTYKTLLSQLKANMISDIMSISDNEYPPIFIVEQTSFDYVDLEDIAISQAQYEHCQEEQTSFLKNPTYFVPSAFDGSGHLNANGYRWNGEYSASLVFKILTQFRNPSPITPDKIEVSGNIVTITPNVAVPPLKIDSHTIELQSDYGFIVKKDGTPETIQKIEIIQGSAIKISCTNDLSSSTVIVGYAGNATDGKGNIRDSSSELSFETYVDDTTLTDNTPPYTPLDKDGNNLYGKKYPLYNWMISFYIELE